MRTHPKFGKRPTPAHVHTRSDMPDTLATVREWVGQRADAATVNRLAAAIARRADA